MPSIGPPQGYIDLPTVQSAATSSLVSVIGVVVDYLPPKNTKGTDVVMSLKLQDPRLRDAMYSGEGLKVRFFGADEKKIPPVKAKGDIVLLRGIRVHDYANERILMSHKDTKYLIFSGSSVPAPDFKLGYMTGHSKLRCEGTYDEKSLGPMEQDYIITMKTEMDIPVQPINPMPAQALSAPNRRAQPGPGNVAAPMGPAGAYSGKFKLVKDLKHYVFSDICVEVVKTFTNNYGNCELYVTDYTPNNQMFYYAPPEEKPSELVRDGDRFGYSGPSKKQWPGPYGFLVLKVNLAEPHASFANQNVAEGDMIALENVKVKMMPDSSRLEGDMWPDRNNPTKVQVRKLRPDRKEIINLCLRKEEYWAPRLKKAQMAENQATEAQAGLTKTQRKKLKKERKAEEERQKAEKEAAVAEKKITSNQHVRCTYKDQPLATISNILDPTNARHTNTLPSGKTYHLPFINARHHIKARVVDFYPPKLVDFAVQISHDDEKDNKSEYSVDMEWSYFPPRWEWSFALQVEEVSPRLATAKDAPPPNRLWLNLSHMEAQHLLGNAVDDPADLRKDTTLLNQLREKLYILWGDLEERKRSEDEGGGDGEQTAAKRAKLDDERQPSNLPFNCCLQEYGVLREGGRSEEIADWERQYMMFGVTII